MSQRIGVFILMAVVKTALVTGAHGFTGRYMVQALKLRGYRVISAVHNGGNLVEGEVQCDLASLSSVQSVVDIARPDMVIHLAAISFVGHEDLAEFYRVNVIGTTNLLEALSQLQTKPSKVLLASSANVYGTPDCGPIGETVVPAPVNHYANSKLAMENIARSWFSRLPIIVARPFNYTGAGQADHFLIPKIVSHFKRGCKTIELGNLDVSRDFSDVRDVVKAYCLLLESSLRSEVFNVCSGGAVSLEDIISRMSEIANYEIKVVVNPDFVRNNEIKCLQGNGAKLCDAVCYQPEYSLDDTLLSMYCA